MTLDELIATLEVENPNKILPDGFTNPHSYRGYYDELAFEPTADITVGEMLADARDAKGETFQGWKGGEYKMTDWTDCWLAVEGSLGETIGPLLLRLMLAAGQTPGGPTLSPRRALTSNEHSAAWHAIEGTAAEEGADPDTVLNAVLAALGIDPPAAA